MAFTISVNLFLWKFLPAGKVVGIRWWRTKRTEVSTHFFPHSEWSCLLSNLADQHLVHMPLQIFHETSVFYAPKKQEPNFSSSAVEKMIFEGLSPGKKLFWELQQFLCFQLCYTEWRHLCYTVCRQYTKKIYKNLKEIICMLHLIF